MKSGNVECTLRILVLDIRNSEIVEFGKSNTDIKNIARGTTDPGIASIT